MIYMLNLVFDAADGTESDNGRFKGDDSNNPPPLLQQSQVWLKQSDPTNSNPNPDLATDWALQSGDNGAPIQLAVNDQVWIRACGVNMAGFVARLTTIVARDAKRATKGGNGKALQQRGSPFSLNANQSCVLYDTELPTYQSPSAAGSWVQKLGAVTFTTPPPNPKPPNFHDSYNVVVAMTTGLGQAGDNDPVNVRTYSHDPDMDVSG